MLFQSEPTEQIWLLFPYYDGWNFRLQIQLSCQAKEPGNRAMGTLRPLQQGLSQIGLRVTTKRSDVQSRVYWNSAHAGMSSSHKASCSTCSARAYKRNALGCGTGSPQCTSEKRKNAPGNEGGRHHAPFCRKIHNLCSLFSCQSVHRTSEAL